jgi:dolichyl-phosphate mannosyltransferase polypeptide 3
MLRYQKFLALVALYLACYVMWLRQLSVSSFSSLLSAWVDALKPSPQLLGAADAATLSPFLVVVGLGVYAVADIMYTVLTFNDCKDAAEEIDRQVLEARKEMKKRKIKVGN